MINLRLPKIDSPTPQGQIKQIHSYLHQTIYELQMELDHLERELEECKEKNRALEEAINSNTRELRA